MGVFEFVLILVALVVLVEAGTKLLAPLSRRLADLVGDMVDERRQVRGGHRDAPAPTRATLPDAALEEIEDRLARIEDRLGFLEELKAPPRRSALGRGSEPEESDRGADVRTAR
jgi:hypothetical protein